MTACTTTAPPTAPDVNAAGEWHEIKALQDGTVFVNVFAEGKA